MEIWQCLSVYLYIKIIFGLDNHIFSCCGERRPRHPPPSGVLFKQLESLHNSNVSLLRTRHTTNIILLVISSSDQASNLGNFIYLSISPHTYTPFPLAAPPPPPPSLSPDVYLILRFRSQTCSSTSTKLKVAKSSTKNKIHCRERTQFEKGRILALHFKP